MRTCCKAFQQHSNVERAQCAVSTRGSRPMKRWERVKKRGGTRRGGGWDVFRERDRGREGREGEGEIPDTHQQTGGHTKRELKKKKLVTFLRHLKTCWLFWDACCLLMSGECLSHFPSDHVLMVTVHDKQLNAPLPLSWPAALYVEIWHYKARRRKAELSRFGSERRSVLGSFFLKQYSLFFLSLSFF